MPTARATMTPSWVSSASVEPIRPPTDTQRPRHTSVLPGTAARTYCTVRCTCGAADPAGEPPVRRLEPVGLPALDPERGRERPDDLAEPAGDESERPTARRQALDQLARSGGEHQRGADLVEHLDGEPGQGGDAFVEGGGEVQLAVHRPVRDRCDLVGRTGAGGEQVDHLGGDQRRVDVHHDEPARCVRHRGRVAERPASPAAQSARIVPFGTTVMPLSVTVNPRARSCSRSM